MNFERYRDFYKIQVHLKIIKPNLMSKFGLVRFIFLLLFVFQSVGCFIYFKQEPLDPKSNQTSGSSSDGSTGGANNGSTENNDNGSGNSNSGNSGNSTQVFNCANYLTQSNLDLKGAGTDADPYVLCNANQFVELSKPSSINYFNKVFQLQSDIDLSTVNNSFLPIGDLSNPFKGKLLGNNKTIKNWNITQSTSPYVGVFGVTENALIKNLNIENISITHGTNNYVGALVGHGTLNTKIEHVRGTKITISGHGGPAGGLVGALNGGMYDVQLNNQINITEGNTGQTWFYYEDDIGRLVGKLYIDDNNDSRGYSSFLENVKVTSASINSLNSNTGGIAGSIYSSVNPLLGQVRNATFSGTVIGKDSVGGIAGGIYQFQIAFSKVDELSYIEGSHDVGGIGGYQSSFFGASYFNSSFATVKAQTYEAGGLFGYSTSDIYYSHSGGVIEGNRYVGGITGFKFGGRVINSSSESVLRGDATDGTIHHFGGLAGLDSGADFKNSIYTGTFVNVTSGKYGGLIGECNNGCNMTYTYWDKDFSGTTSMCSVITAGCNNANGKTTSFLKTPSNLIALDPLGWSFAYNNTDNTTLDYWDISHTTGYPVSSWIEYDPVIDSPFASGDGTKENPYLIMTADQLNKIGKNIYLTTFNYKLGSDIDFLNLSSSFDQWGGFLGTLDGQNFKLENFSQSLIGYFSNYIFYYFTIYEDGVMPSRSSDGELLNGGFIKNLKLNKFVINNGTVVSTLYTEVGDINNYVRLIDFDNIHVTNSTLSSSVASANAINGGIASICNRITNSSFSGTINGVGAFTGGLCGIANSFKNVSANANITTSGTSGTNQYTGGLFGYLGFTKISFDGLTYRTYEESLRREVSSQGVFVGTITVGSTNNTNFGIRVGGAFGVLNRNVENISVMDSRITNVNNYANSVGGVVGSYNTGDSVPDDLKNYFELNKIFAQNTQIISQGSTSIGGLIGTVLTNGSINAKIKNSYSTANIQLNTPISDSNVGGFIGVTSGSTNQMDFIANYSASQITASAPAKIGGFIALTNDSSINYDSNFWDQTLNPTLSDLSSGSLSLPSGVQASTTTQLKQQNYYPNMIWDFSSVWKLDTTTNGGYPSLK